MRFVEFERNRDVPVWINADQVRMLKASDSGQTQITFDERHGVTVMGKPNEVAKRLSVG